MIKKENHILIVILILALSIIACEPPTEAIDVPQIGSKLVLSSQIESDFGSDNGAIYVYLARTVDASLGDDYFNPFSTVFQQEVLVSGALVTLSYNNKKDTLIRVANGIYKRFIPLIEKAKYTIEAYDTLTKETISAQSILYPEIPIDTAYAKVFSLEKGKEINANYEFTDLEGKSFYLVNIYDGDFIPDFRFLVSPFLIYPNEFGSSHILSDDAFEGIEFEGIFESYRTISDTVSFTVSQISESYYTFLEQKSNSYNYLQSIFQEPILYTTNVEGGFGFFSLDRKLPYSVEIQD